MPPSIEALTSSSAPGWSTVLIALKRPLPSPNVIVPKQSLETRRPVLPSVAYSMMPSNCWYIRGCHENNAEKRVGRPFAHQATDPSKRGGDIREAVRRTCSNKSWLMDIRVAEAVAIRCGLGTVVIGGFFSLFHDLLL